MKRLHIALSVAVAVLAIPAAMAQMGYGTATPAPERNIEANKADAKPGTQSPVVAAINVEQPKPKCEDPGPFPGRVGMQTEDRRNKFIKGIENYKNCMMGFIEERKAVIKANETAARAAIEEFNGRMKKYQDEQEKSRE